MSLDAFKFVLNPSLNHRRLIFTTFCVNCIGRLTIFCTIKQNHKSMDKIELIEKSFSKVVENKHHFINKFYSDLFEMAPEVEYLFKKTTKEKQGEKLYEALVILVENISSPEVIEEILKPLGEDHVGFGAQPMHYKVVGECLINAIKNLNGDHWNDAMGQAWMETYDSVAKLMIR